MYLMALERVSVVLTFYLGVIKALPLDSELAFTAVVPGELVDSGLGGRASEHRDATVLRSSVRGTTTAFRSASMTSPSVLLGSGGLLLMDLSPPYMSGVHHMYAATSRGSITGVCLLERQHTTEQERYQNCTAYEEATRATSSW